MRPIDADELRKKAQWMEMPDNQGINFDVQAVSVLNIDYAPTIEIEPIKHGQWEKAGYGITERVRCSCCKSTDGAWMRPPFCSQCGAKMERTI